MDGIGAEGFDAALTLTNNLDHLPFTKRRELARILQIIFDEVESYQSTKSSAYKRFGKILKIILFGSYSRGDWVEDRLSGYRSDYDLLIVVDTHSFAETEDLWLDIDDRFIKLQIAGQIKTPTSLIIHSLQEVNDQLARGRPFFVDLVRDGNILYEADGHPLARPRLLTSEEVRSEAQQHFEAWRVRAQQFIQTSLLQRERKWHSLASFNLHQATEALYHCVLLTKTLYSPKLHRIKTLRSKAEDIDARLIAAWPRDSRLARRRFELLSRAYVEARYSPKFEVSPEELQWLIERVQNLQQLVEESCRDHLDPSS